MNTHEEGSIAIAPAKIIIHELWDSIRIRNDIALIKLQNPVQFSDTIQAACLPEAGQILPNNYPCYATYWVRRVTGGPISAILKQTLVLVVDHSICRQSDWWGNVVTEKMLCVKRYDLLTSCTGESGGPLNCQRSDGTWDIQGVKMFSSSLSCNLPSKPTVFTRVASYIDWINKPRPLVPGLERWMTQKTPGATRQRVLPEALSALTRTANFKLTSCSTNKVVMKAYLKTLNWIFKLKSKRTTVGRHKDADLCLQNGGVEEHHATIEWNEAEHCYVVSDLNSVHGTYVNDCRIHNAAVRLTPGDELHFGYGGSTYELILDTKDAFPVLPVQSAAPTAQTRTRARSPPVTPRPPDRPRPASAGAKRTSSAPKTSKSWGHSYRAGSWCSSTGRELSLRNITASQSSHSIQDLIQDKEETWVRQGEELSGVIMREGEAQRKECVMAALKDEVSALRLQLAQSSQSDPDVRHKLNNLARDIQEKKEEIQQLKEQMLEIQRNSGELVAQAVAEREQRISSLRAQLANLKSENSKCSVMVNNLQKDLVAREKQTLKLAAEVDKLRQAVRYKDAQLSNMATKLSQMKETEKHQEEFLAQEKVVESLKKTVERLEGTLREKQNELKQQNTERDSLKHRLEQMTQEQVCSETEMSRLKVLQQHTLQRGEKAQTELRHSQTRLENLYSQIKKCVLLTSETVSEKEVLERLSELAEEKEEFRSRIKEMEQQLQEHTENQRLVEEDSEKLKARLAEWQIHAKKVCMVDAIQSQISALQDESVCPAVSWVQTHTLSVLTSLHTLLQDTVNRLQAAGMEVSEKKGGVSGTIEDLCQQHWKIQAELKSLKAEKEQLEEREAQAGELQDSLEAMRQELEHQKLQIAERQAEMENTVKLQLEKMKTDLESARTAEVVLRLEMETRQAEWIIKLEKAKEKERELREKVKEREKQEEQWRERNLEESKREWLRQIEEGLQRGAEEERERIRVEIEEYKEQVRQHAHTIVAMEKQVSTAQQREREMEEERDSLTQQLTEALSRLEEDKPSIALEESKEQQQLEQTVTSLRASLEESQKEVVRQGEVITSLSRDLAHAHARLSDLTGELSEQQKIELETHKALVVDQRMQLSMLTQKLTMTSQLLEQKDEEQKMLREKLTQTEKELKSKTEDQEYTSLVPLLQTQQTKDASLMVSPSDFTPQSSKGKSHCREEMMRQQRETLAEMRARIRAVEQKWPSKLLGQQVEPVMQGQMKTHRPQRFKAQRGSISYVSGFAFPEALSEAALERTARLDMSDALELSERTYVDLARALCEALELSQGQLSGCVPLKHLPPAERERLVSLRQDDLELFRNRLALQNSQSQNTHLLLQQSQREIHTLRESQAVGQQLQAELDSVHTELEAMKQESAALRQALQLTQTQLQSHRDQCSTKNRKALSMEGMDVRSERIGHHNCIPKDNYDKVTVLKRRQQQDRRRRREAVVDTLKSEPGHKEQAECKMAAQLTSVPQPQQSIELTEAH
ncbi:hypothetical protein MHYP_G00324290 [Metynnis hypsauchen]